MAKPKNRGARYKRFLETAGQGKRLWWVNDLANYLGVGVDWVYEHNAEIPHIKKHGVVRYDPDSPAFQAWLAGRKENAS